jgi:hypothetical protein
MRNTWDVIVSSLSAHSISPARCPPSLSASLIPVLYSICSLPQLSPLSGKSLFLSLLFFYRTLSRSCLLSQASLYFSLFYFFIALDPCARVCLFELLFLDSIPFALFSYIPLYYSSVSKKDRWLGFRISRLLFAAMLLL